MSLSKDGAYGWQATPRDVDVFVASTSSGDSIAFDAAKISLPSDSVSKEILTYAQQHLASQTFNHSIRIYLYGYIISHQHLPHLLELPHFLEAYFASCMLHDIGTTDENIVSTKMSFEFKGAMIAMDALRAAGAEEDLVEQVAETIIRHQDVGTTGTQTAVGALIHVTTLLDNAGAHPELIHKDTIESVVKLHPRNKWTSCFAGTIRKELKLKPWAHSSHIENFAEKVEANKLMVPYD